MGLGMTPAARLVEQRRYSRFKVNGVLTLTWQGRTYGGRPLNISGGGILFFSEVVLPDGAEVDLEMDVIGFRDTIKARFRKLRTYRDLSAGAFLGNSESLDNCIEWLSERKPSIDEYTPN